MKTILIFVICLCFALQGKTAESGPSLLSVAQLKQDFTQLFKDLESAHINLYENESRQAYQELFENMLGQIDKPMSRLQATIFFQQFVAFGKVAHANIGFPQEDYQSYRDNQGKAFPVYVKINHPKWFVAENYSDQTLPVGTEITQINGQGVDWWMNTLRRYISADTPQLAGSLLEFQLPQYLWLHGLASGQSSDSFNLTVLFDGQPRNIVINSVSVDTLRTRIEQQSIEQETQSPLRDYRILEHNIGYLKPGPFYNAENPAQVWDNNKYVAFIDQAMNHFIEQDVQKLIIDVRENPGGDKSFSDPLIAWFATKPFRFASEFLVRSSHHAKVANEQRMQGATGDNPTSKLLHQGYQKNPFGTVFSLTFDPSYPRKDQQFQGKVYVLIDRSSYSNAVSLAAIVKDYGFGTVIGEPTTDFATTLGAMETFTLQHSGIKVGFPKALIIRPSGDKHPGPVYPDMTLTSFELADIVEKIHKL